MIHIYYGDGKGKTTAATGLCIRAAGAGKRAAFAQFLKDGRSSELLSLSQIENIEMLCGPHMRGFFSCMTETQKVEALEDGRKFFEEILAYTKNASPDMLVLDEVLDAAAVGVIPRDSLYEFLLSNKDAFEIVLTGHLEDARIFELADYISEIKKIKHPFDRGVKAREGIEY